MMHMKTVNSWKARVLSYQEINVPLNSFSKIVVGLIPFFAREKEYLHTSGKKMASQVADKY